MNPPRTEAELLRRARELDGLSLAALAERVAFEVPPDLRSHKGWVGHLIEAVLGTNASSRGEPDFPHLGIELKTIPIDADGAPLQSTWVCVAPLDGSMARRWQDSRVHAKLSAVLWVPVDGDPAIPPAKRRVRSPRIWRPSDDEEALIRQDWEFHSEVIGLGELWQLDARNGEVLQIRPKALNSSERVWTYDDEGERVRENPKGFYLRRSFTKTVLER